MTESWKLRSLASELRNRAASADIGENRNVALAMAARFEAIARASEERETASGTNRVRDVSATLRQNFENSRSAKA